MPHIGIAMERSLQDRNWRDAFASLLSRSAVAALGKRQSFQDISGDINDAKTAFSSWDNCFQANICKWPVIALFIVAGLIIFSILWCIIRCCCCGLSCCCECCYCLKCCGECCGMCDPPRGKRNKYLDEPFVPQNHDQAYRSQAPMNHGLDTMKPSMPQYAEFDSPKNADALPPMPSWEGAGSRKVLVEDNSVEMDTLKKPSPSPNSLAASNAGMPRTTSPRAMSPYGPPSGAQPQNGYMGPSRNNSAASYGMNPQGRNEYDNRNYGQPYSSDGMNSMVGVATAGPLGRQASHGDYNTHTGYDQGYSGFPQSRSPQPYDEYVHNPAPPTAAYNNGNNRQFQGVAVGDPYGPDRRSPAPQPTYGGYPNAPRMNSPPAQANYATYGDARGTPSPQPANFGLPQTHSPIQDSYPGMPMPTPISTMPSYPTENAIPDAAPFVQPSPIRAYDAAPVSPIRNNSGFDFNSGYSRPVSRASPAPAAPAIPPATTLPTMAPPTAPTPTTTANGGSAYPGYRPYRPAAQDTQ